MLFPVFLEVCRRKVSSSKLPFLTPFKNAKRQRPSGNFAFADRKKKKEGKNGGFIYSPSMDIDTRPSAPHRS